MMMDEMINEELKMDGLVVVAHQLLLTFDEQSEVMDSLPMSMNNVMMEMIRATMDEAVAEMLSKALNASQTLLHQFIAPDLRHEVMVRTLVSCNVMMATQTTEMDEAHCDRLKMAIHDLEATRQRETYDMKCEVMVETTTRMNEKMATQLMVMDVQQLENLKHVMHVQVALQLLLIVDSYYILSQVWTRLPMTTALTSSSIIQ